MEDIDSPGILSDEYSEYDLEEENYEIDKQDDDGKLKGKQQLPDQAIKEEEDLNNVQQAEKAMELRKSRVSSKDKQSENTEFNNTLYDGQMNEAIFRDEINSQETVEQILFKNKKRVQSKTKADFQIGYLNLLQENSMLRQKLKQLNSRLSDILTIQEQKKPTQQKVKVDQQFETASMQKKLGYYQNQWNQSKQRLEQLEDPEYLSKLMQIIKSQDDMVKEIEQENHQLRVAQNKQSKTLGGVLDTGETEEMANQFGSIYEENRIIKEKLLNIQKLKQRNEKQLQDSITRADQLQKVYQKLLSEYKQYSIINNTKEGMNLLQSQIQDTQSLIKASDFRLASLKQKEQKSLRQLQQNTQQLEDMQKIIFQLQEERVRQSATLQKLIEAEKMIRGNSVPRLRNRNLNKTLQNHWNVESVKNIRLRFDRKYGNTKNIRNKSFVI